AQAPSPTERIPPQSAARASDSRTGPREAPGGVMRPTSPLRPIAALLRSTRAAAPPPGLRERGNGRARVTAHQPIGGRRLSRAAARKRPALDAPPRRPALAPAPMCPARRAGAALALPEPPRGPGG